MKRILSILFIIGISLALKASSITATQSGNWNQTDTWGGLAVPDGTPCYDTIIIPAGITVLITVTVNLEGCPPVAVIVSGALNFDTGKKLLLSDGSYVYINPGGGLQTGGGGGSSNIISIDGTNYWSAGCGGSAPPDCGTLNGPGVLCQNCALPIELVYFSAKLIENTVSLEWKTKSELDNDYYYIQRSKDGINWQNLLLVDGAGTSSVEILYQHEDRNPYLGVSFYRLMQVDFDGSFTFSPIETVTRSTFESGQEILVLTATSNNQTNISIFFNEEISGEVEVYISSSAGNIIYSHVFKLSEEKWLSFYLNRPIASGVYFVRASRKIEKVVLS